MQMGPGTIGPGPNGPRPKWDPGPNGTRAQWDPGPNGTRAQMGPGPKWDPGPNGPKWAQWDYILRIITTYQTHIKNNEHIKHMCVYFPQTPNIKHNNNEFNNMLVSMFIVGFKCVYVNVVWFVLILFIDVI